MILPDKQQNSLADLDLRFSATYKHSQTPFPSTKPPNADPISMPHPIHRPVRIQLRPTPTIGQSPHCSTESPLQIDHTVWEYNWERTRLRTDRQRNIQRTECVTEWSPYGERRSSPWRDSSGRRRSPTWQSPLRSTSRLYADAVWAFPWIFWKKTKM